MAEICTAEIGIKARNEQELHIWQYRLLKMGKFLKAPGENKLQNWYGLEWLYFNKAIQFFNHGRMQ